MNLFFLFYCYLLFNGLILFFLIFFKLKKNPATKYFFFQYITLLLLVTEFITIASFFKNVSWWCYPDFPVRFLLTPFIYLYVCTYINPQYRPSVKTKLLLFLPALIEIICFVSLSIHYYKHPFSMGKRVIIANTSLYYVVRTFLSLLFNLTCIILAYREIKSFTWNIFRVLSNYKSLRFNWIKVILGISIVLWVYWLLAFTLEIFYPGLTQAQMYLMYLILYLLIALVVLVFGYFAILKPYVPEAYLQASAEIASINNEPPPDVKQPVADAPAVETGAMVETSKKADEIENQNFQKWFEMLEEFIQKEKVFTQPDLTLTDIAKKLETSSFTLSKSIKQYSNEGNFYEYINRYRLLYFIDLLVKTENDAYTIQALAQKSGFSSPSTLSKYCRKNTGNTPARIKQLIKEGKKPADLLLAN